MVLIKSPEQELFDYFFKQSLTWGYETYDHLPMQSESVNYPFVIIGDIQTVTAGTKFSINNHVLVTIDIWGNQSQRLAISTMADRFFHAAVGFLNTTDYQFFGAVSDQEKQQTTDYSVENSILNRATLTLNLSIC